MAEKDYLYEGDDNPIKKSVDICQKYTFFHKTFLYYKGIHYTENVPQNSATLDLQKAV